MLLRAVVLGYDVEPAAARRVVTDYVADRATSLHGPDAELDIAELGVLSAFADVGAVTRDRRRNEGDFDEQSSPREQFNSYLRTVGGDPASLPVRFRSRLEHALTHYGVGDLEPTPELSEALTIFVAHQRRASHVAIITALLGRQLDDHRPADQQPPGLRDLLDRLIDARRAVAGDRQPGAQRPLPLLRRADRGCRPSGPARS